MPRATMNIKIDISLDDVALAKKMVNWYVSMNEQTIVEYTGLLAKVKSEKHKAVYQKTIKTVVVENNRLRTFLSSLEKVIEPHVKKHAI